MTDRLPTLSDTASTEAAGSTALDRLYHMSRTAGAGTTNYSEINVIAVVGLVLGLMSFLALFGWFLLVIPLAGLLMSLVGLNQISKSGGTQTGKLLALGGLMLSLGFAGVVGYQYFHAASRDSADQAAVLVTLDSFSKHLAANDADGAYDLFDARFRERVPKTKLKTIMDSFASDSRYGKINAMKSNGLMRFSDGEAGVRYANAMVLIDYDKADAASKANARLEMQLRLVNGQWTVFDIPEWFPADRPGASGGNAAQRSQRTSPLINAPPPPGIFQPRQP